jgi:malate/lactate dehydrogenase
MANDIFAFFNAVNQGDFEFVDSLSEEEAKKISPFVLLMWMHGAQSNPDIHIIVTNSFVNPFVFSLSKHHRFLLKLFIAANCNIDNARYKFVKSCVVAEKSIVASRVASYYNCGLEHAKDIIPLLSDADLKELEELYVDS